MSVTFPPVFRSALCATPFIRSSAASSAAELGENIVVQGGTFLNNAVLRSFEREIGHNVIRPEISGLMGAFGASLYAKALEKTEGSTILSPEALRGFTHKTTNAVCHGCTNNCRLTVNIFPAA